MKTKTTSDTNQISSNITFFIEEVKSGTYTDDIKLSESYRCDPNIENVDEYTILIYGITY